MSVVSGDARASFAVLAPVAALR